jgi:hypothetical protein
MRYPLADAPGIGRTITAGLVINDLLIRSASLQAVTAQA